MDVKSLIFAVSCTILIAPTVVTCAVCKGTYNITVVRENDRLKEDKCCHFPQAFCPAGTEPVHPQCESDETDHKSELF